MYSTDLTDSQWQSITENLDFQPLLVLNGVAQTNNTSVSNSLITKIEYILLIINILPQRFDPQRNCSPRF
jgi:hypothetical protein